jgi:hypothetical protein
MIRPRYPSIPDGTQAWAIAQNWNAKWKPARADESRILIGAAGKMKLLGLQAALATAWDTMMSPVDVRSLTLSQMTGDAQGQIFQTGKAAIGTLTLETQTLLNAYIESLPFTLHPETPLHTRGGQPGPKGGRPPSTPRTRSRRIFARFATRCLSATNAPWATSVARAQ